MATFVNRKGEEHISTAHHHTGILPFMAKDLLNPNSSNPIHRYRHDLESFFYILIWAAIMYSFGRSTPRAQSVPVPLRAWNSKCGAYHAKLGLYDEGGLDPLTVNVRQCCKELWNTWIEPLYYCMFHPALAFIPGPRDPSFATYDIETCNGQITLKKFMDLIKVTPRGLNPVGP